MSATSKSIIYFSRFQPISEAGGGCRRTAQIADALKDLCFAFVSSRDYPRSYKNLPEYQDYIQSGVLPAGYIDKWQPTRQGDIAFMHYVSWTWANLLGDADTLKLAMVDDPLYFSPLVKYLASKGIPVVALCHNIETLSRSQLIDEYQTELLNYELGFLSLCSMVITISREETVFLRNLGIDTFYFPYYPVDDIQERMMIIREKRKRPGKVDFLLVGTAHNPPTMKGMEEILRQWSSINKNLGGARLFVAGYGSEPLKDLCDGKEVVFKGALSNEDLDGILANIKACIAYQADGSGALTKICEFLLAGIPVLANSHAARSYYNTPGVIEFTQINDLNRALGAVCASEVTVQLPAPPDDSLLALRISDLCGPEGEAKAAVLRQTTEVMLTNSAQTDSHNAAESQAIIRKVAQYDEIQAGHDAIAAKLELDAIKAHRNELLNSLSWRVTAPLRYIAKFFIKS